MTTTLHLPSFFSQPTALVEGEAHHHLFKVKRLQTGERLRVIDGEGHARWAEITGIDKRAARLALGEPAPANEPPVAVEIFVAAPKPDRTSWLMEKLTEIGVVAIHFISTDREARSIERAQLGRLQRIAVSAVEQSGRSRVPEITVAGGVGETMEGARAGGLTIVVLDSAGAAAGAIFGGPNLELPPRAGIFVGPEGGWSPEERERFRELGVPAWSLGATVLRVETAAVVAAGWVLCGSGLAR